MVSKKKKYFLEQKDLFVGDITCMPLKADKHELEFAFFRLSKKKDLNKYRYEYGDTWIEIIPSIEGAPTIYDQDILFYAISQLVDGINKGQTINRQVRVDSYSFIKNTHRGSGGNQYKSLVESLNRLAGCKVRSNLVYGNKRITEMAGFLDNWKVESENDTGKVIEFSVTLNDWIYEAVRRMEILTITPDYYKLTGGFERRVYQIARKHTGRQKKWSIGLDKLYAKSGATGTLRRFRHTMKQMVEKQPLPDYQIGIENNLVTFYNRQK